GADANPADPAVRRLNAAQRGLARELVNVSYTADGRYRHDPARFVPPVPQLAAARQLAAAAGDRDRLNVLITDLRRGRNHVVGALDRARHVAEATVATL